MQRFSAREKYLITNTLNCIPVLLQGRGVLIDLRNETSVAGIMSNSDGNMTCELTDVVFIDRNGAYHAFDNFMVRNRMIRQIHVPADLDVGAALLQNQKQRFRPAKLKPNAKRTFKQKRAEERHKETLEHISKKRNEEQSKDTI